MPYFERKPWQKTIGNIAELKPGVVDDDIDIAELAQSILAAETAPRQASDGPFRCRKPVHPGGHGIIVLSIEANDDGGPVTLDLSSGDLRNRSGDSLSANLVQLEPAKLTIPPGGNERLEVHVRIPRTADPGVYSGRVTGNCPEPVNFVVEYEVAQKNYGASDPFAAKVLLSVSKP